MAQALVNIIDEYLNHNYVEAEDCLVIAAMAEIKSRLYKKLENVQGEYSLKLTHVQALAIHVFYHSFINDHTSYTGNKLLMISNEVAKTYAL